jgi:hypothetical protein
VSTYFLHVKPSLLSSCNDFESSRCRHVVYSLSLNVPKSEISRRLSFSNVFLGFCVWGLSHFDAEGSKVKQLLCLMCRNEKFLQGSMILVDLRSTTIVSFEYPDQRSTILHDRRSNGPDLHSIKRLRLFQNIAYCEFTRLSPLISQ